MALAAGALGVPQRPAAPRFGKSTPPQNRQLIVFTGNSKQQVDDFMGELTF
jgi:hypothetical protein